MGFWNPFSDEEERKEAVNCKQNGDSFFHGGHYQEAIKHYRRAIQLEPKYDDAHYALGFVYYRLKQYEDAESSIKTAIKCNPGERRYHYRLGRLYLNAEAFSDSVRSFKTASKLDPDDHESLYFTALAYRGLDRSDWAVTYLQRALQLDPGNADYKKVLEELPRLPEPKPELLVTTSSSPGKTATKNQPGIEKKSPEIENMSPTEDAHQPEPYLSLEPEPGPGTDPLDIQKEKVWESLIEGDRHYDDGNYSRALTCYRDALVNDPTSSLAYCCQAKVFVRTGEIAKARLHADMAYRIDSRDSDLLIEIASVYVMMEDYWKALELLKEAALAAPGSAAAINAMGAVYINLGDPRLAVEYFRKAIELEPDNDVVKENLEEAVQIARELQM